ncbi:two-component sensor histidine kinase [Saccharothrix sp. ALI-22-I]|uniref:sensor histidine kinase n=1 Tax=Saccharothrix sp. ALI-22-I TaxID=1933778 RepID=UPI00097C4327|nr:HAMP domain-containing sensor histidine kinase [Saccharothrix sp. ALI-22-I]ONI80602.1 two-component sensor histidine kinase [Saccharothrix sp. ALI-22-I]
MSSSLRPEHWSARTKRWPLRTRLVAAQVVLLAVVCAIIGVATGFALRDFLVRQLDGELRESTFKAGRGLSMPMPGGMPPSPLDGPGFRPGTLVLIRLDDGVVDGRRLPPDFSDSVRLSGDVTEQIQNVPADGIARTVTLDGELGDYRVLSLTTPSGAVVTTGLPMADIDSIVWQMGWILGGVALAGLIATSLAGVLIVRRTLRPLERVAATAGRVAELPLHEGEVALAERVSEQDANPDTEVGQVGLALNRMLGHIGGALQARHDSETRVRQFVADASHELRTPLAAIRGYAELTRRTPDEVPPQIAHAMRRVESEAVRMTSLVEDLLLLARLDAGRPLGREPVDLSRLVVDTVSDARIAGSDHEWRLELPPEAVQVTGDTHKLHQVLANLLSNARTHTPPGTKVTTSLSIVDGAVEVAVTDDGPGIPEELQADVFERFSRGDTSRSRAAGSTGLGLSIVAAVVASHEGSVRLDSRPGRTTFTVRLPR